MPTKAPKYLYTYRMFVQRGPRTDEALSIDRRDDRILAQVASTTIRSTAHCVR